MRRPVRVTTRADYYDEHGESVELWSPGSPAFPDADSTATIEELVGKSFDDLLEYLC